MKKIAAVLCVVPLFLSLNLISVSADPSAENSVNEITALEQEILEFADQCREEENVSGSGTADFSKAYRIFEPGIIDYPAKIAALLEENGLDGETAEYTLAGGVPGIRTPLVLVFENGELRGIISPDCDLTAFEEEPARAGNGGGPLTLEQGKLYPFSHVREVSLRNRPQDGTAGDRRPERETVWAKTRKPLSGPLYFRLPGEPSLPCWQSDTKKPGGSHSRNRQEAPCAGASVFISFPAFSFLRF